MIVFVVINIVLLIYLNTYWIHNIPLSHTYAYLKWFFYWLDEVYQNMNI